MMIKDISGCLFQIILFFPILRKTFACPALSYTLWPDLVCLCFVRYLRGCSRGAVTYCPFLEEDLMIKKLFSGGQPGADRAGLMAARKMGIQTGVGFRPGILRLTPGCDITSVNLE